MKQTKILDPSIYLCQSVLESDEKGMEVINELKKNNLLTAPLVEKLAIRLLYNQTRIRHFFSAIHIAAFKGRTKSLKMLLAVKSVNCNIQDDHGWPPFHFSVLFCASSSNLKCVKLLAQSENFDFNVQNDLGFTALMHAVRTPHTEPTHVELLKFLLSQPNIDFNIQNMSGHTILHYALRHSNSETAKLVMNSVLERFELDTFTRFIFPWTLRQLSGATLKKFNELLANAKNLLSITYDCDWNIIKEGLQNNYSVIEFLNILAPYELEILERNRKVRSNCFEASITTFLIFKRKLNRDMGNLFASWVWETRGTKIWSF